MSDVLEKLVKKYVSGSMEPDISLDQIPYVARDIERILMDSDIFIGDVYSTGHFYNISLENGDEDAFSLPGPYRGDVVDIDDFCNALSTMKEAFPGAVEASREIRSNIQWWENFNRDWDENNHLECQMITRSGKITELHLCPDDGLYHDYDMHFYDELGNLYQKEYGTTRMYICEPSGESSHSVGKLDVRDLWERFGDVPMNPETEELESPWMDFPAETFREDIWHWFEKEFHVSVGELMHDIDKVDKELLSFDKDDFNLKENRSFTRKKIQELTSAKSQGR